MKKSVVFFILFGITVTILSYNFYSPIIKNILLEKVEKNHLYSLPQPIIKNSQIVLSDTLLLKEKNDYIIDYDAGKIEFFHNFKNVHIELITYPENLTKKYQNYFPTEISDSLLTKIKRKRSLFSETTTNLNISGSKTISFTVSNGQDVTFDQTLFLKINGQLSENINIESQLSDNQTPITTEGNSKELSSLDNIYIRIFGRQYELKFGDLEMEYDNTRFINYHPFFEGIKAKYFKNNYFKGAIALSKGKKGSAHFYCEESKQGPYYLSVQNNTGLKIVPSSEEIYLNGVKLQRGTDYTIDYSDGSIIFTDKHFISAISYVTAYFLYTDEFYRQNLYLNNNKIAIGDNIEIYSYLIYEADDKKNPLTQNLSEDDINILKQAGDNTAWGSGVTYLPEGGDYKLSDSGTYYIYSPNDSTAVYSIRFTFVGFGNGDYTLSSEGDYYVYVGEKQGDYLPIIKLVAPQKKVNYDMKFNWVNNFLQVDAEGIITDYDKNEFSSKDDKDNYSGAYSTKIILKPDWDKINPILTFDIKSQAEKLKTFSNINDEEISNEFMLFPDSLKSIEKNISLYLSPFEYFTIKNSFSLNHVDSFGTIKEWKSDFNKKESRFFPELKLSYKNQNQLITALADKKYTSYRAIVNKTVRKFSFKSEINFQKNIMNNNNNEYGERNYHILNNLIYKKNDDFALKISYANIQADSLENSKYEKKLLNHTIGLESKIKSDNNFLNFKYQHRIIIKPEKKSFDMADINLRNNFLKNSVTLNSSYKINNLDFYPKIRELIKVSYGLYDSTGALGGEGGYDWVIKYIDYDHPKKSTEVNLSSTLNLMPSLYFKKFPLNMQFETYALLYENSVSSHKKEVYLFNRNYFFNKAYSILSKKIFRQTVWTDFKKFRYRFDFKINNTLDQRFQKSAENTTKTYSNELNYRYSPPISFKILFDKEKKTESIYQSLFDSKKYEFGFFYRPNSSMLINSTLGFQNEYAKSILSNDDYEIANYYTEENVTLFLKRRYRMFFKVKLGNRKKNSDYLNNLNDKKAGFYLKGNMNFNYKLNKFTSATVNYDTNLYENARSEHKLSIEVKAEF